MHHINTPLFATTCIGLTISHVHVFPTHITYEQKLGVDITVASAMIASVEKRVYEHGFVILRTTSRRRVICMVQRKHADALYGAIRDVQPPSARSEPRAFAQPTRRGLTRGKLRYDLIT